MKRKLQILFGVLLFIAGGICFLFPNIQEWHKQKSVDQIIEHFEESYALQSEKMKETGGLAEQKENISEMDSSEPESEKMEANNLETMIMESESPKAQAQEEKKEVFPELYSEMESYNKDLFQNGQQIVDAWSYEQTPLDLSLLNSDEPVIGYIEIPDMKVRLPLFLGASPDNLGKGAAVLSETSMPIGGANTNCVIAGHRGWNGMAYFQRIENLTEGSKVYITNPWETLVYKVASAKIIGPDDVSSILIQPGEDMITLFTCHPYVIGGGPYRYLVFCKREGTQERSVSKEISNPEADPIPERTTEIMQMDSENVELPVTIETEESRTAVIREGSDDLFLNLEETLRTWLPVGTIILAAIIVILRLLSSGKERILKKKCNSLKGKRQDSARKREKKKKDFDKI